MCCSVRRDRAASRGLCTLVLSAPAAADISTYLRHRHWTLTPRHRFLQCATSHKTPDRTKRHKRHITLNPATQRLPCCRIALCRAHVEQAQNDPHTDLPGSSSSSFTQPCELTSLDWYPQALHGDSTVHPHHSNPLISSLASAAGEQQPLCLRTGRRRCSQRQRLSRRHADPQSRSRMPRYDVIS